MVEPLSGYDEFLRKFRAASGDPLLDYWSDVIYVMRWNPAPLVERRFKGGITCWLAWAIKTLLLAERSTLSDTTPPAPSGSIDGFRILPTPAHQESLTPLIDQAEPGTVVIYGASPPSVEYPQRPIGFPTSLAVLNRRECLAALREAMRIWKRIRRVLLTCDPPEIRIPRDFSVRLIEQIFTAQMELAKLRKFEPKLRTLFVTYELAAESKALVMWARERRSRIVHVMHGQRLPTYQLTLATDLVLLSKLDEPWFRERVASDVRIWSVGHPRLEKIRRQVGPSEPATPQRLPRISFFSQPSEGDYSRELRDADWRLLSNLAGKAEIRFRRHPRESKNEVLSNLRRIGLGFIAYSEAGLEEDLAWCDAIASSWSTVSLEAAACGRGVFWSCASPERYGVSEALRQHGIGALIQRVDDWQSHLDAWNAAGWAAPVIVPDSRLRELGIIGDTAKRWLERLEIDSPKLEQ